MDVFCVFVLLNSDGSHPTLLAWIRISTERLCLKCNRIGPDFNLVANYRDANCYGDPRFSRWLCSKISYWIRYGCVIFTKRG